MKKSKAQIAEEAMTCPPRDDDAEMYEIILAAFVPDGDMETEDFTFCHSLLEAENMAAVLTSALRKAGYIHPQEIHTEWGYEDNFGPRAITIDDENAEKKSRDIVRNMRSVGREAYVVWRGVTKWVRN